MEEIIAAVDAAKRSTQSVDKQPHYKGYVAGELNTAFRYELADDTGKHVARAGLADLDICLPYTLAFVPQIQSVDYTGRLVRLEEPDEERVDGEVQFLSVTTADTEGNTETSTIAVLSKGLTTIAMPIEQTGEGVRSSRSAPTYPGYSATFRSWEPNSFRSRWSSTTRPSIRLMHGTASSSRRHSAPIRRATTTGLS